MLDGLKWNEVDEDRYDLMLNILPPVSHRSWGFLVGEPWNHRKCRISGVVRASYVAFIQRHGRFYECDQALTVPEFAEVNPMTVGATRKTLAGLAHAAASILI